MPADDDQTPVHATDALANERTFLAYLRTALALVGFGFVIARFALFGREFAAITHANIPSGTTSILLGASMAVAGIVTSLFGAWRYIVAARGLRAGKVIPLNRRAALISSIAIALVCLVVAFDLVLVR